jgi:drug/metabolite transporter (DMT)-like permease
MSTPRPKRKIGLKDLLVLQGAFVIFSMASVFANLASASIDNIFSLDFLAPAASAVGVLAVYAVLWQQIIKRFDLSIAYANKATALLWTLVWGTVFFHENITLPKVIGIVVVFAGVVIMNSEREEA